jgi:hypothetical protein
MPAGTPPGKAIDTLTTRFAMADWNNAQVSPHGQSARVRTVVLLAGLQVHAAGVHVL